MAGLWRRYQTEILVALTILAIVAPLSGSGGANEPPRVALTASLVESRSVAITDYESTLSVDFAVRNGELYSDKAPGTSLLFVPVYAAFVAASGSDFVDAPKTVMFLFTLVVASIPAAILAGLLTWSIPGASRRRRGWTAIMLSAGTMLLPFATVGFGHVLAALLAFTAFLLARSTRAPIWTAVGAGAAVGLGVAVEYPVAIVALGLLLYLAFVAPRRLAPFVLGGLPFAVGLGVYHNAAFGHPLTTSYRYADAIRNEFEGIGLNWPNLGDLLTTLFGERGLLVLTPVVAVALVGLVIARREMRALSHAQYWLVTGIVIAFLLLPSIWGDDVAGPTGGWSPGPRFVVPVIPFMVWALAAMLSRWPRITTIAGSVSILVMSLATITRPLAPHDSGETAIVYWLDQLGTSSLRGNAFVEVLGPIGWVVYFGVVGVFAWLLTRSFDAPGVETGATGPTPVAGTS